MVKSFLTNNQKRVLTNCKSGVCSNYKIKRKLKLRLKGKKITFKFE